MGTFRSAYEEAIEHRQAAQRHLDDAERLHARRGSDTTHLQNSHDAQRNLAKRLTSAAGQAAPGWLGLPPTELTMRKELGSDLVPHQPTCVRIGVAEPIDGVTFPALVPILGAGHLATDVDARDPRVAGLLRNTLLRIIAAAPVGTVKLHFADAATSGSLFSAFAPLGHARLAAAPATDAKNIETAIEVGEAHMRMVQDAKFAGPDAPDIPHLIVVMTGLSSWRASWGWSRLEALAHSGPDSRVNLLLAGVPTVRQFAADPPNLDHTTFIRIGGRTAHLSDPPGEDFSAGRQGLDAPVTLDEGPPDNLIADVCSTQVENFRRGSAFTTMDLLPAKPWQENSTKSLRTLIGREVRQPVEVAFDDETPHWLVGGRTGSGKTVFILSLLYGLAARYSPDELEINLLDFKEGVSFSEFTSSAKDPSWLPHVRAIGIESDRQYGVAVLTSLRDEMLRRSVRMKRAGVTRLSEFRELDPTASMPRVLTVIDEFHVLFSGNDSLAKDATGLLEEVARKGRSYGIHLVLASQTAKGIESLFAKGDSIFGQLAMRVALPGASDVLDKLNNGADQLTIGSAIINNNGGVAGSNREVRFPNAAAESSVLAGVRRQLWENRPASSNPPAIFAGFAEQHIADDKHFQSATPAVRSPKAFVGRVVDVAQSTAQFTLDSTPGKHVAVLGPSSVGADVVHAALLSLAAQHDPGSARFILAPLVDSAEEPASDLARHLTTMGHTHETLMASELPSVIGDLRDAETPSHPTTYVGLFGADVASNLLAQKVDGRTQSGLDDLRSILKLGPGRGIHLVGWWRGIKRFSDDIGGSMAREDVACLVALNVAANEVGSFVGNPLLAYEPRENRALFVDRHENVTDLIVPFVRPGRLDGELG